MIKKLSLWFQLFLVYISLLTVLIAECNELGTMKIIFPPRQYYPGSETNTPHSRCNKSGICLIPYKWQLENNLPTHAETINSIQDRMFDLTYNSDKITKQVVPFMIGVMARAFSNKDFPEWPPNWYEIKRIFHDEQNTYSELYPRLKRFQPEVQTIHHGIRYIDQKVKNFIKDRDIVDIGSYVGDSMLVLQGYTNRNIYCFDINEKNFEELVENSKLVGEKVKPIFMGLGSKEYQVQINSSQTGSLTKISEKGNSVVNISTLNIQARKMNMKIGLIKADVEGMGYDVMLGARETIERDRPVFAFLVYHCYDEFYQIPQMLREIGGYLFEYRCSGKYVDNFGEGLLLAIPQEVYYPKY